MMMFGIIGSVWSRTVPYHKLQKMQAFVVDQLYDVRQESWIFHISVCEKEYTRSLLGKFHGCKKNVV